jgi:hypothetical protein
MESVASVALCFESGKRRVPGEEESAECRVAGVFPPPWGFAFTVSDALRPSLCTLHSVLFTLLTGGNF